MRAVFESTWARLPEPDRRTFAALFIFCGGFTAKAATGVTGLTRSQLLGLVDRSLVQRLGRRGDEERYDLHPLMRQFVGEKLGEGKRFDEVAERHGRVNLNLVMASEAGLFGPAPQATVSSHRPELDNVRHAWQWAASHGQRQLLHNAASALAALYEFAGLFEEVTQAFAWAAQQLDRQAPGEGRDSVLCELLGYQVSLTLDRGVTDVAEAMDRLDRLTHGLNNDLPLAKLHLLQGRLVERLRGFDVAISYYERAAELFEALEQPRDLARALNALGFAMANLGKAGEALETHRRSLRIAQALDDVRLQVLALALVGFDSHYLSRHEDALAYWEEALTQYVTLEDDLAILRTSNNICYGQNMLGNYEEALQVAERLQRLLIRVADHVSESDAHDTLGDIYFSSGDYSQALYHYMHAIENARAGRVRLKGGWCLTGLAELEIAAGRYAFAENHLARAQSLYQEEDPPRDRARLLAALGELCWRTGRHNEANDFSLQLINGLGEDGEPTYTSPLLVRAGRILLESGDFQRAQTVMERGLMLAQSISHKPTILRARLQLARLAHLQGTPDATQALEGLLPSARRNSERADVLYAL